MFDKVLKRPLMNKNLNNNFRFHMGLFEGEDYSSEETTSREDY